MIPPGLGLRFPKGCRVQLSAEGWRTILHNVPPWLRRGTVVGHGRDGNIIRVLRDGTKRGQLYGAFFWERYK